MSNSTLSKNSSNKNRKLFSRSKAIFAAFAISLTGLGISFSEAASAATYKNQNSQNGEIILAGYYASPSGYPYVYQRRGNYIIPSTRCARCIR